MKATYNQLTEMTGFSYRTIRKRIDGLDPVGRTRNNANQWDSHQALPMLYGFGIDDGKKLDGPEEKARLDRARRICQELKNKEIKGDLVRVDEIKEQWARIVVSIRTQFLALPARLGQMIETTSTPKERREMIDTEVRIILTGLADAGERGDV